ncbi:MAG: NUDIX domain-containing protein [Clostridia bacterium]|nr:NUDIX domain-containing protein [Clostridia bacterium]
MITEKSCGAVVFTRIKGIVKYVIIQSKEGFFGFPKGHLEANETETETALREIFEETGLKVDIIAGFKTEDRHTFLKNGETRMKHVVYFLAEYSNQALVAQESELNGIFLMDYETAVESFQFESSKRVLTEANSFLQTQ